MLYIILILVILILLFEKFINKQNNNEIIETIHKSKNYSEFYEKKEYLLTKTELTFYKALKQITDKINLNLFVQIPLYTIIKNKNYKDFNKIKSKSIDFVITEKNCKIKLCIELDDYTHNQKNRIERDKFINKLFQDLNIKLLRFKTQNYYNLEELETKIRESL